ncbi:MAG: MFS transporter [Candidatus Dormibacteraeota bacterium]|nr:MFS transporter [Candidatus Dormibacteraeota bacterium]
MTEIAGPQAIPSERLSATARNATIGAFLGLAVDFYDIYLPVVALTPALAFFEPGSLSAPVKATLAAVVFAVTLFGRPIGSVIFGHFGDVLGRRRTTLIAVGGFGVMTLLIAILPGYATWGYGAIILLILLRLIDGVFMGGEYTSANPLAMEYCPKKWRGMVGGIIQAAYPVGYIAILLVTSAVFIVAPVAGGVTSAYAQWGWRVVFGVGAVLAGLFLIYFWRTVSESTMWEQANQSKRTTAPLKELFSGQSFRNLAQVFLLMTGMWVGVQVAISFPPVLLETIFKLPPAAVTTGSIVAYAVLLVGYIIVAQLGQMFGRRLMFIISGAWTVVVVPILYYLLVRNGLGNGSVFVDILLFTLILLLTIAPWGLVTSYITERFATGIRSSGYGIGYSLAVIIPSFYTFYQLGLSSVMPYDYTMMVLAVIAGVLVIVGALIGPETRDVDLHTVET